MIISREITLKRMRHRKGRPIGSHFAAHTNVAGATSARIRESRRLDPPVTESGADSELKTVIHLTATERPDFATIPPIPFRYHMSAAKVMDSPGDPAIIASTVLG